LRAAFAQFVENLPFYGFAVLCIDHPEVQALAAKIEDRRVITYGFSPQADVRLSNLVMDETGGHFDLTFQPRGTEPVTWAGISLPMMGEHNVLNAAGALAVVQALGGGEEEARTALAGFTGVKRRFTLTGQAHGVTVVDDYGHHPVEITAVLKAARQQVGDGRVHAVVQPHRYSRLHDLFDDFCTCFNDADSVLVTPVFAAGEAPIEGASQEALVAGLARHGHRNASATTRESLPRDLKAFIEPGDLIVCLGAGDITAWAAELPRSVWRRKVELALSPAPSARGPRQADRERVSGRHHLAARRRSGASVVPARRRRRSGALSGGDAARYRGAGAGRGLQHAGA
jgi:UDP-N-acetylmuramate--alanine ligase